MKITTNTLKIGEAEGTIRLLHTSDNHLSHADERDGERKIKLAESRYRAFGGDGNHYEDELDAAIEYATENCDLLVHTGDVIDFVSRKNLELAKQKLSRCEYFIAAGNHEFSLYVGEAKEDDPYRAQSFELVQSAFANPLDFASRVIKGVNLVAADNGYYYFRPAQTEALKRELERGLPIILLFHTPLYTRELYDKMLLDRRQPCAYLAGAPDELLQCYDEHRREQQKTTPETERFISLVRENCGKDGLIKAILAGHLHFDWEGDYFGVPQYVTGGGVFASAREIVIAR